MNPKKTSFEALKDDVIDVHKCTGCAACVVACPFGCLGYVDEKPQLLKECRFCGVCTKVCPQYNLSMLKIERSSFNRRRRPEETFGVYRKLVLAQAVDDKVLNASQDGGLVTTLLLFGLKNGIIDGAVTSGLSDNRPFFPVPKLVTTYKDVLKCAGTRYSYSPNILALTGKVMQKRNLAFVGTPCQIRAVRQMQLSKLSSWPRSVRLLVGLMCSECFSYERLMGEIIQEKLGADLNSVRKMNIKGRLFITHDSKTESISLAEVKKYSRTACKVCDDFSSELADLSVGGLGVNRWSFVVIRSKVGEEVFSRAVNAGCLRTRPVGKEDSALDLLVKLSNRKRMLKKLRQATGSTH